MAGFLLKYGSPMARPKIFIIGLDAATWDLLKTWTEGGDLRNIAVLMPEGLEEEL